MKPTINLLVLLLFVVGSLGNIYQGIKNENVERNVDLSTQFVKENIQITIKNVGKEESSKYILSLREKEANHLSYFAVSDDTGDLKVSKDGNEDGHQLYEVTLREPLASGQSQNLKISLIFTHSLTPYPASIAQNEKQFVLYNGNAFFFSPYSTTTQTTSFKLGSSNIKSHTEVSPSSKKGDTITYGPYENKDAYSFSEVKIHYENNKPFLTVTEMVKEIEISHWGNVAVEENYKIQHDGALLKGTFSRFDYQRNPYGSPAHVSTMKQHLPHNAADVYYRDEIGNITTSHLSSRQDEVLFELSPRYPLFGGWKATWYQGYNLPLSSYLFNDRSDSTLYVLNITFSTNFDDVVIDHLTTRIILPEGASDVQIYTPFEVSEPKHSLHFTYLDTSGRPVISVEKTNLVNEHNQYFQVTYHYGRFAWYHEPFLLVSAFFIFFLSVMIYMRLNFKIGQTKGAIESEKIADILLELKDIFEKFESIQESLEKSLEKYLTTKNEGSLNNERHNARRTIENLQVNLNKKVAEAEELNAEVGKKLKEMEKKQRQILQEQEKLFDLGVSFGNGKISQKVYESKKSEKQGVMDDLSENIRSIFDELGSM